METEKDQVNELENVNELFENLKNGDKPKTNKLPKDFLLKKYFVPRNDQEYFRIVKHDDDKHPIVKAYFHVAQTNLPNGKKKNNTILYCPSMNGELVQKVDSVTGEKVFDQNGKPVMVRPRCPICEKAATIKNRLHESVKYKKAEDCVTEDEKRMYQQNKEILKESFKWEAKLFYIARGVDKAAEKDGIKFWRFKHNYKKTGVLDYMLPSLQNFVNKHNKPFYDVDAGCDLTINMVEDRFMGHTYKKPISIIASEPKPLHVDENVKKTLLNEKTHWRDVFKEKSIPNISYFEYLEMVVNGESPYWDDSDSRDKHWVFPNRPDLEELARNNGVPSTNTSNDSSNSVDDGYVAVGGINNTPPAQNINKTPSDQHVPQSTASSSNDDFSYDNSFDDDLDDLPF